jgi:hypothetical protein
VYYEPSLKRYGIHPKLKGNYPNCKRENRKMDASKLMSLMKDKKQSMARKERAARPKPGKNRIVLLQGWKAGEEHVWFHDFGQHYIKNAAGEIKAVYPCAEATYGTTCAVCDGLAHATRMTKDDDVVNLLAEAKAGKEVLINALDLDSDNPNTPVVYAVKRGVFSQMVDLIEEWGAAVFGKELVLQREGKGLNTKYTIQISPKDFTPTPAILAALNNLDDYVKQESEEQAKRALGAINGLVGIAGPGTASASPRIASDKPLTSPSTLDDEQEAGLLEMELTGKANPTPTATSTVSLEEELDGLLGA